MFLTIFACLNPLRPSAVDSIEPGNATGSTHSGSFDVTVETTECSGVCAAGEGLFRLRICDVGEILEVSAVVAQNEGALEIDWIEPFERLRGSLDNRDRFDVGSYVTLDGGAVELTVRARGTFTSIDRLEGTASSHAGGEYSNEELNCDVEYLINGSRTSSNEDTDAGPPCGSDDDCLNGLLCNDKLDECQPLGDDGYPCFFEDDCIEHCNSQLDECQPPGDPGYPCFFDNDCVSDSCNSATRTCN